MSKPKKPALFHDVAAHVCFMMLPSWNELHLEVFVGFASQVKLHLVPLPSLQLVPLPSLQLVPLLVSVTCSM